VRDAFITNPRWTRQGASLHRLRPIQCPWRKRQYMGSKDFIGFFYAGHLNQLVEPTTDQCAKAAYRPFPNWKNSASPRGAIRLG